MASGNGYFPGWVIRSAIGKPSKQLQNPPRRSFVSESSLAKLADGQSQEEALKNLDVVIGEWIKTAQELKREVPPPWTAKQLEEMQLEFQKDLERYVNREVETAVQRVLQDLARSQTHVFSGVLVGHSDPADWWKRRLGR